jgi:hypothetical protein
MDLPCIDLPSMKASPGWMLRVYWQVLADEKLPPNEYITP